MQQPIVYIKEEEEIENKANNYFKVKYNNSEIGWYIDKDDPQQINSDKINVKPLKIFSYEQYEKCVVNGKEHYKLTNSPLTADYDQLSAAEIYTNEKQVDGLTDMKSVVTYLKNEQEKLISFPADKYLRSCKEAAKRLVEKLSKSEYYPDINKDINLLSEVSEVMAQIKEKVERHDIYDLIEKYKTEIIQESDILQLKLGLLGVCGKSVTKNTMELGNILDYSISHGLEILHFPPEPIKLKHVDNEPDEEFLVIDGEGNPRVARNLEGVLFFMNDQRNKGICCLEPNPLCPIKVNLDKSPHEIQIDENSSSPLLINGFYTSIVELQKKLKMEPFPDKFIYAERLMMNSDFVPRIKLPDDIKREDVQKEIETDNLIEAYKYYECVLDDLANLRDIVKEKYDRNFLEFCQKQNLSGYLETKDEILDIFDPESKNDPIHKKNIKEFLSKSKNLERISSLKIPIDDNTFNILELELGSRKYLKTILNDERIRTILLDNKYNNDLKVKMFEILPNINLLKGLEIENKSKNFLDCLDDYIDLVQGRQSQIKEKLVFDRIKICSKMNKKINKGKRLTNINGRIKLLKEERRRFKDKRNYYDDKLKELKIKKTKNYWQQKISNKEKVTLKKSKSRNIINPFL